MTASHITARYLHARTAATNGVLFLGDVAVFIVRACGAMPLTLAKYRREIRRQIGQVTLGAGLLITFTGTVGIIVAEAVAVGVQVGIEGFNGLQSLGIGPLTGFISAYANTREIAPIIAAIAIASQVGCKFTAQIGAQRISEEIDALEVMAIPSLPYIVTTRIIAVLVSMVPLYLIGLAGSYFGTEMVVKLFFGQSAGTYDHYFHTFLNPIDILYSMIKVIVFCVAIVIIHTFYGYHASGGPAGVGIATARAIRASMVFIAASDVLMTMLFWGLAGVRLSGG